MLIIDMLTNVEVFKDTYKYYVHWHDVREGAALSD